VTVGGVNADTKKANLEYLYGYHYNNSTMCTLAIKNTVGVWQTHKGTINRLTFSRNSGEGYYELIMEFLVGTENTSG